MRLIRLFAIFCPFFLTQLASQPVVTSRIDRVRSAGTQNIEIDVISERAGHFEEVLQPKFRLRENGLLQDSLKVEALSDTPEPSRTVILADLSKSVSRKQFSEFKRAADKFVGELKEGDLVALITFQSKVYRELNFTADRALLKKKLRALKQAGSRTMLYDGLIEAHKMLTQIEPKFGLKKAIVVYTDGKENASRVKADDLLARFTADPVPVFVAGKKKSGSLKRLIRLARVSGGDAFRAEEKEDLAKIFHYLGNRRAEKFRLSYKTAGAPGQNLELEVETGHGVPLARSFTLPHLPEKIYASGLPGQIRTHMPEILLSLIVLLLIAVILMLVFRKQEINVKVENSMPQAFITDREIEPLMGKKFETNKAKLPLEYYHSWLVEKEGPHTGRKYKLTWHSVTLGFSDDNSIVIEDNTVSSRHAKIEREGNKSVLYDLLSERGTFLNGKKLLRPKELEDFDEIGLGRTRLIFRKGNQLTHEHHAE